jgi:K+-sensing histidine kinase KdpD
MNLFDNAVKYGHQSTDVTVNCHIQRNSGDLMLEIINVGNPVPRELWEKIFDSWFSRRKFPTARCYWNRTGVVHL